MQVSSLNMNCYMFNQVDVDLEHAYIDGTKLEANANKHSWFWRKSCIKKPEQSVWEAVSATGSNE